MGSWNSRRKPVQAFHQQGINEIPQGQDRIRPAEITGNSNGIFAVIRIQVLAWKNRDFDFSMGCRYRWTGVGGSGSTIGPDNLEHGLHPGTDSAHVAVRVVGLDL